MSPLDAFPHSEPQTMPPIPGKPSFPLENMKGRVSG